MIWIAPRPQAAASGRRGGVATQPTSPETNIAWKDRMKFAAADDELLFVRRQLDISTGSGSDRPRIQPGYSTQMITSS
ncbi:MAG TPA: hypothetical protein VIF64_06985 [Pyrinomonadaceae bacterium]